MAPVVRLIREHPDITDAICVTGQHREMLAQVLDLFEISADYDLQLMRPDQDLADLTAKIVLGVRDILRIEQPSIVLVHGDTSTTFGAALASYYEHVPVGHVEAGLRTGDIFSPWPEEANRRLAGILSILHFAPTTVARDNLISEGVSPSSIEVTGNTVIDALHQTVQRLETDRDLAQELSNQFPYLRPGARLILVTGHRRESFGPGFQRICQALKATAEKHPDVDILYPAHLNPNVQRPVNELLSGIPNIYLVGPLEYTSFVYLMKRAYVVLTDSGGIQEEAPSLGKPVLVMRESTERPEAVDAGTVKLVGSDVQKIVSSLDLLLHDVSAYRQMKIAKNPYGDGKASRRILDRLLRQDILPQTGVRNDT